MPNHTEASPLVSLKDITKSFGNKNIHSKLNLDIYNGETLVLLGSSGSGKSILLRMIIGLEKPDKGSIVFMGEDLVKLSENKLLSVRQKISYVFQYGALFDSLTVEENLAFPLREHTHLSIKEIKEKIKTLLKKLGLLGTEKLLPSKLSGGMQRRIGVARSIIMEPKIILYDEPTTGLDPYNIKQMIRVISELNQQGATTVVVTHDISSFVGIADRVAFLRKGKIYSILTPSEIEKTKDPLIKEFIKGDIE